MKTRIILISLLLLTISCVQEKAKEKYITRIHTTLQIDNIAHPEANVFLQKRGENIDLNNIDTLNFTEGGNLVFNFEDSIPGYYRLIHHDFYFDLYLSPRDSLHIHFDNLDLMTTLKIKGERGKQQNRYLAAKRFFMNKYVTDSLFMQEPKPFNKSLLKIRKEYMFALNEANLKQQGFRKVERRAIDYILAKLELIYPSNYEKLKGAPLLINEDYYDFVDNYHSEDQILLQIPEFIDFYSSCIILKAFTLNENTTYSKEDIESEIDKTFKKEEFRNFFKNFLKL